MQLVTKVLMSIILCVSTRLQEIIHNVLANLVIYVYERMLNCEV